MFGTPIRDYDGVELTARLYPRNGWSAYLGYRWSKLRGNYEGLYRPTIPQADPHITTSLDFPATSAVDDDGDGLVDRFAESPTIIGMYRERDLPTDRRHVFQAYVSKQLDFGLNAGARLSVYSGQPRTSTFAHPTYGTAGEVPGANPRYWWLIVADGSTEGVGYAIHTGPDATIGTGDIPIRDYDGDGIVDGVLGIAGGPRLFSYASGGAAGRSDDLIALDLHLSYDFRVRGRRSQASAFLDAFNVLDDTSARAFNDWVEVRPGIPNANEGRAVSFVAPRSVRLGVRFTW
jgi:hypothetical protein